MNTKYYDVVVCGGGVAGVAAAIAAARTGAKTVLIEKQIVLGGLATSGLIYIYLPLDNGWGKKQIGGLSEEMIRRCVEYGPFDIPERWGGPKGAYMGCDGQGGDQRLQCCFSPAGFELTLDKMLEEAKVDLWYDTLVIDAEKEGSLLKAVTVANTSGTVRIEGKCFVDATGGAYVAQRAGCKVHHDTNWCTPWFMEQASDPSFYHFTQNLHIWHTGVFNDQFRVDECNSGKAITDFVRWTYRQMRERYDALPPGEIKNTYPVMLPGMPQLRKLAHIDAEYRIGDDDLWRHFEDSIGIGVEWRAAAGPSWETPYRSLLPKDLDGLLAAGRCMGTYGEAWEVFRVIPNAAMAGEAAGIAAAFCAEKAVLPRELEVKRLQDEIVARKGILFVQRPEGPTQA